MAFFKFRKGGDEQAAAAAQPESVDVLRRRAKNRLIGAVILVLAGVIGFPLLVDKQPRPVAVDLPIEIPDRNRVLPLNMPEAPVSETQSAPEPASEVAPAPPVQASPVVPPAPPAAEPPAEKAVVKPAEKPAQKTAEKTKPAEKAVAKPADKDSRYVVQVGAFAESSRVREVRLKLERAGLRNYTQVVETADGRRVRVRAGPYASKAEADRAADKIKKLELPATVLAL